MAKLFVSYSRKDSIAARKLIESGADHALPVVSADGSLLASRSSTGAITILRYQDPGLTEVTSFVKDEAASLAFHPERTLLAVVTGKKVYLIDTANGTELARIPHLATVNGVSFSADGNYTLHGHKLRLFTLWEAQFVTRGIISCNRVLQDSPNLGNGKHPADQKRRFDPGRVFTPF